MVHPVFGLGTAVYSLSCKNIHFCSQKSLYPFQRCYWLALLCKCCNFSRSVLFLISSCECVFACMVFHNVIMIGTGTNKLCHECDFIYYSIFHTAINTRNSIATQGPPFTLNWANLQIFESHHEILKFRKGSGPLWSVGIPHAISHKETRRLGLCVCCVRQDPLSSSDFDCTLSLQAELVVPH